MQKMKKINCGAIICHKLNILTVADRIVLMSESFVIPLLSILSCFIAYETEERMLLNFYILVSV